MNRARSEEGRLMRLSITGPEDLAKNELMTMMFLHLSEAVCQVNIMEQLNAQNPWYTKGCVLLKPFVSQILIY